MPHGPVASSLLPGRSVDSPAGLVLAGSLFNGAEACKRRPPALKSWGCEKGKAGIASRRLHHQRTRSTDRRAANKQTARLAASLCRDTADDRLPSAGHDVCAGHPQRDGAAGQPRRVHL